jgi:hypothetical protein
MVKRLGIVKRTQLIKRIVPKIECLQKYKSITYVTHGSVGHIFSLNDEWIAKIQILYNLKTEIKFDREIAMQTAFYPKSPQIIVSKICKIGKYTIGIIIMEKLQFELDYYLGQELTIDQLDTLIRTLKDLLAFAKSKKLIHGDTALFNFGRVKRLDENNQEKLEWIFIDFDKSSQSSDFPNLDYLRIAMEFYPCIRSRGTKPIHNGNECYLKDKFSIESEKHLEETWRHQFDQYIKNILI